MNTNEGEALNDRQKTILEMLRQSGQVQVDELARLFDVTTQTVRRDLADLCDQGLAARIHGGARRPASTSVIAYDERRLKNMEAKQRIASATAKLIPDEATLSLNIGTTTEQVAEALKTHRDLTVISNNINIVHVLRDAKLRSLVIAGGEVRLSDGAIVGAEAVETIRNYKVDFAIIGASSLDAEGSVLDFDQREVAVARAILENARTRILVCDGSKFEVTATYRICNVAALDIIITDKAPPASFVEACEAAQTELLVTDISDD